MNGGSGFSPTRRRHLHPRTGEEKDRTAEEPGEGKSSLRDSSGNRCAPAPAAQKSPHDLIVHNSKQRNPAEICVAHQQAID